MTLWIVSKRLKKKLVTIDLVESEERPTYSVREKESVRVIPYEWAVDRIRKKVLGHVEDNPDGGQDECGQEVGLD